MSWLLNEVGRFWLSVRWLALRRGLELAGWFAWGCLSQLVELPGHQEGSESDVVSVVYSVGDENRFHSKKINNVLLRKNDTQILSAGSDGYVALWDRQQQTVIRRFVDPDCTSVWTIALTPDEQHLIMGGAGKALTVWNIESGDRIARLETSGTIFSIVALSDNQRIYFSDDRGIVTLWQIGDEKPLVEWQTGIDDIMSMTIRNDEHLLVTGGNEGEVVLWDIGPYQDGNYADDEIEPQLKLKGLASYVCSVCFSPNGTTIVGCDYSGTIALWDPEQGEPIWRRENVSEQIGWVRFVDEDSIVAVDDLNRIYRGKSAVGEFTSLPIDLPEIAGFALSADHTTCWTGGCHVPCAWNIADGKRIFPDDSLMLNAMALSSLGLINDQVFATDSKGHVRISDMKGSPKISDWVPDTSDDLSKAMVSLAQTGPVYHIEEAVIAFDFASRKEITRETFKELDEIQTAIDSNRILLLDSELGVVGMEIKAKHTVETLFATRDYIKFTRVGSQHFLINQFSGAQSASLFGMDGQSEPLVTLDGDMGELSSSSPKALIFSKDDSLSLYRARNATTESIDEELFNRLVQELDSQSFQNREQATLRLTKGGPDVLNRLQKVASENAERRARIYRIVRSIEEGDWPTAHDRVTVPLKGETIQNSAISEDGSSLLVAVKNGWRSDLLVYEISLGEVKLRTRHELRASVVKLERVPNRARDFLVGYSVGVVDLIKIQSDHSK